MYIHTKQKNQGHDDNDGDGKEMSLNSILSHVAQLFMVMFKLKKKISSKVIVLDTKTDINCLNPAKPVAAS